LAESDRSLSTPSRKITTSENDAPAKCVRIESLPGFSPLIGRLVSMLTLVRRETLVVVADLSMEQLDHLHDANSNSIGALLAHMAAAERVYQVVTFEERDPTPDEKAQIGDALSLGADGRRTLRGKTLDYYIDELATVRRITLATFAARDDVWLERSLAHVPEMNAHWAWFHVMEDEIGHRGQIRWLRARIPENTPIKHH
jgi:uncharacterized damage-inducible protein DinB